MTEENIDEKTIEDCVMTDIQEMENIQKAFDIITGHHLMCTGAKVFYRECWFIIKRAEE